MLLLCCAAITGYKVVAVPVGGGANVTLPVSLGSDAGNGQRAFTFPDGRLADGKAYTFYTTAVNSAGESNPLDSTSQQAYTTPAVSTG